MEINENKRKIKVTVKNNSNFLAIKRLISQKGELGFYETINRRKFISSFIDSRIILSRFNGRAKTTDVIGCASKSKVKKINKYIETSGLDDYYKFAWLSNSTNQDYCLYALNKIGNGKGIMGAVAVEGVSLKKMNNYMLGIQIKFKTEAAEKLKEFTWNDINESIAVLIDNQMYFAPVVKSIIRNGNCEISCGLSDIELKYFVALASNGELPTSFKLVK